MQSKKFEANIAGKKMVAEFSDLADQTNGSVIIRYEDTVVLVTAVMSKKDSDADYLPLVVDYEEKFYSVGKILGGRFIKREGKPSDEAILSSRMIDRTIRPLFDQGLRRDVQVVATALVLDGKNDPGVLAINGASIALSTGDIPWNGPASAVRVAIKEGSEEILVNPNMEEPEKFSLDMLVCARNNEILMIESRAKEVPENLIANALEKGLATINEIEKFQKEIISEIGKIKLEVPIKKASVDVEHLFKQNFGESKIEKAVFQPDSKRGIAELENEWEKLLEDRLPNEPIDQAMQLLNEAIDKLVHKEALKNERRADDRKLDEIRPLFAQAGGFSDLLHGTGIFYRGGTHVMSVVTLGGPADSQLLDGVEISGKKYFMHHYNFPPFSTGEVGRMGNANRRSIGHGALAEKALLATLPDRETFPYTIRIVSESTASNGSTSMASVCASTLALMDAGVPIKNPTAGIAMGLMLDETAKSSYKILTDIQGPEDHYGDMDFKVAGTKNGVTAIQLDIKLSGVPLNVLIESLDKAREARAKILEVMKQAISSPREKTRDSAPKVLRVNIPQDEIGTLIGPGGRNIQSISERTGATLEVEQNGLVTIVGKNGSADEASKIVTGMFRVPEPGENYDGEVVKIMDFGIFVKIDGGKEGLVHISEIAPYHISNLNHWFKEGETVPVVVKEIDQLKRINFSIKMRDPEFANKKGIAEDVAPINNDEKTNTQKQAKDTVE